jgi:hypothetical protein
MATARPVTSALPERAERSLVPVLVLVFAAMSLVAVWRAEFIAFQDYPSYLIIKHYHDPAYGYSAWFALNPGLAPNQGADLLLWAFALFASPAAALYANFFLVMFFMNFVPGIPFFLFFPGYWTRNRENLGWRVHVVNREKRRTGLILRRALDFLPRVLPPYVYRQPLHSVFESYFVRNGGVGAPAICRGPIIRSATGRGCALPRSTTLFPRRSPGDAEGIRHGDRSGKGLGRGGEPIRCLTENGFREVRGNAFTGIFTRPR